MRLLDDQRRRQRDDVAGGADQHAALEAFDGRRRTRACRAAPAIGSSSIAADQAEVADVDDVRRALSECTRVLEVRRELARRASSRPSSLVDVRACASAAAQASGWPE